MKRFLVFEDGFVPLWLNILTTVAVSGIVLSGVGLVLLLVAVASQLAFPALLAGVRGIFTYILIALGSLAFISLVVTFVCLGQETNNGRSGGYLVKKYCAKGVMPVN